MCVLQFKCSDRQRQRTLVQARVAEPPVQKASKSRQEEGPDPSIVYDAIIIGGGMGGLTTASQMAAKGAQVLVLEK